MMSFLRNLMGLGANQRTASLEMEVESLNDQIIALTGELSLCEKERDHLAADLIHFSQATKKLAADISSTREEIGKLESRFQKCMSKNLLLKSKNDRLRDLFNSAIAINDEN